MDDDRDEDGLYEPNAGTETDGGPRRSSRRKPLNEKEVANGSTLSLQPNSSRHSNSSFSSSSNNPNGKDSGVSSKHKTSVSSHKAADMSSCSNSSSSHLYDEQSVSSQSKTDEPGFNRLSRRRERNRIAAKKSREKRAQFMNELQEVSKSLERENNQLKDQVNALTKENLAFRDFIQQNAAYLPPNALLMNTQFQYKQGSFQSAQHLHHHHHNQSQIHHHHHPLGQLEQLTPNNQHHRYREATLPGYTPMRFGYENDQ